MIIEKCNLHYFLVYLPIFNTVTNVEQDIGKLYSYKVELKHSKARKSQEQFLVPFRLTN